MDLISWVGGQGVGTPADVRTMMALDVEELKCKGSDFILGRRSGLDSLDELREDDEAARGATGDLELGAGGTGADDDVDARDDSGIERP